MARYAEKKASIDCDKCITMPLFEMPRSADGIFCFQPALHRHKHVSRIQCSNQWSMSNFIDKIAHTPRIQNVELIVVFVFSFLSNRTENIPLCGVNELMNETNEHSFVCINRCTGWEDTNLLTFKRHIAIIIVIKLISGCPPYFVHIFNTEYKNSLSIFEIIFFSILLRLNSSTRRPKFQREQRAKICICHRQRKL